MAIPEQRLSSQPAPLPYLPPDIEDNQDDLVDWERGGVNIGDASQGLRVQFWKCFYEAPAVKIQNQSGTVLVTVFSLPGIRHLAFTFDQNMRPAVAYMLNDGVLRLRWYDATAQQTVTTVFGPAQTPRMALDDKRQSATEGGTSDMILAYLRNGGLYYRQQRDRFTVERFLGTVEEGKTLRQVGMNRGWRLQFDVR